MTERPIALITGATRGIGRGIASALADTHHLLIGGRSPEAVASVVAELPSAEPFVCDLTDAVAVEAAVSTIESLDVLIHSAGIGLSEGDRPDLRTLWRDHYELNVVAVVGLTELLLPRLRDSKGLVVLINSGSGLRGTDLVGYSASKWALTSFADALRNEERGVVRVSSIHPGRVDTDMQRALQAARGRPYNPAEHMPVDAVAAAVALAVHSPANAVIESLSIRPQS